MEDYRPISHNIMTTHHNMATHLITLDLPRARVTTTGNRVRQSRLTEQHSFAYV